MVMKPTGQTLQRNTSNSLVQRKELSRQSLTHFPGLGVLGIGEDRISHSHMMHKIFLFKIFTNYKLGNC